MNEALLIKIIQENVAAALLKQGADNTDGQTVETGGIAKVIGRNYQWDGSAWSRLLARVANADALSPSLDYLLTQSLGRKYNGASWDRVRNNAEVTALASAARNADTNGADQVNYNHKGIVLFVNATAFAGDDTFVIKVEGKDPTSGAYYEIFSTGAIAAPALQVYEIHPNVAAASGGVTGVANRLIPRTWRVVFDYTQVTGVADTITASVGACYLP